MKLHKKDFKTPPSVFKMTLLLLLCATITVESVLAFSNGTNTLDLFPGYEEELINKLCHGPLGCGNITAVWNNTYIPSVVYLYNDPIITYDDLLEEHEAVELEIPFPENFSVDELNKIVARLCKGMDGCINATIIYANETYVEEKLFWNGTNVDISSTHVDPDLIENEEKIEGEIIGMRQAENLNHTDSRVEESTHGKQELVKNKQKSEGEIIDMKQAESVNHIENIVEQSTHVDQQLIENEQKSEGEIIDMRQAESVNHTEGRVVESTHVDQQLIENEQKSDRKIIGMRQSETVNQTESSVEESEKRMEENGEGMNINVETEQKVHPKAEYGHGIESKNDVHVRHSVAQENVEVMNGQAETEERLDTKVVEGEVRLGTVPEEAGGNATQLEGKKMENNTTFLNETDDEIMEDRSDLDNEKVDDNEYKINNSTDGKTKIAIYTASAMAVVNLILIITITVLCVKLRQIDSYLVNQPETTDPTEYIGIELGQIEAVPVTQHDEDGVPFTEL